MVPAGRPREFDIDDALDAAIEAFWARGYEATSMADLMDATGLAKGSLYKAFGDKHALYLAALERYMSQQFGAMQELLAQANSPSEAIRTWLGMAPMWGTQGGCSIRRGCMALNSLVELAPHDEAVERIMADHLKEMERFVGEIISRGQEMGEFRTDLPTETMARYVTVLSAGLLVQSKGNFPDAGNAALPDLALAALR